MDTNEIGFNLILNKVLMCKNFLILFALLIFQSCTRRETVFEISNQSSMPVDSIVIVPYGERKEIFIKLRPGEVKKYSLKQKNDMYTISYWQNYETKETTFSFNRYSVGFGQPVKSENLIIIETDTLKLDFINPPEVEISDQK